MQQTSQARLFIRQVGTFASPFMMLFLINALVDPYNINQYLQLGLEKQAVALHFNERLWKLQTFYKNPTEHIIIGDSRAQRISDQLVSDITKTSYTNLSLSGATLIEVIDTFWFAAGQIPLKKVYFCINFDRFNDWQTASGVHQAVSRMQHPLALYMQPETTKATFYVLMHNFGKGNLTQTPPIDKERFWYQQLDEADGRFRKFVEPRYVTGQLTRVATYCKDQGIDLHFIVLPTHQELQERIKVAHLEKEHEQFKRLLAQLGTIHDLDIESDFTQKHEYFTDPWHCTQQAGTIITHMVWNPVNTA